MSDDDIEFLEEKNTRKNHIQINDDDSSSSAESDENESTSDNKPNGAECLSRCKEFAKITNTDSALAMFYLQDNDWDLEKGLNSYFQATKNNSSKVVACFDVDKLNDDEKDKSSESESEPEKKYSKSNRTAKKRKSNETTASEESPEILNKSKESSYDADDDTDYESLDKSKENCLNDSTETTTKHFKLLSWNIDGIDNANLQTRAKGVVTTILKEKPDVVFFQEVVRQSESILIEHLKPHYDYVTGNLTDFNNGHNLADINTKAYYTMIFIRKKTCSISTTDLVTFENTMMERNLLKANLIYKNMVSVCVMTTHLESTKEFSKQRIDQLKKCFKHVQDQSPNSIVFFGGDLNLRDSELNAIGGIPKNIYDAWEATGSRKECLYTWDCSRNTNLTMNCRYKPKCRFDRLYYRPAKAANEASLTLMPVYFELEGLTRVKDCGRFCSDHWAIQCYCQLEPNKNV